MSKPWRKVLHVWGPRDFKKMEAFTAAIGEHTQTRYRQGTAMAERHDPDKKEWAPMTITITCHGRNRNRIDGVRQRRDNTIILPEENI